MCDKANICELRKLAADLEVGIPRFRGRKHFYQKEDVSPYIERDLSKCILCRRCVRACREIAKQNVFDVGYRGFDSKIVVDCDRAFDKEACKECNVCVSFCPTGALSRKKSPGAKKEGKPLVISGKT